MGGDNMQVRRVASGINDSYRGVFLNRGVFVKAPPSFFAAYPSDFEQPPQGWEKLSVTLRTIQSWDRKTGILPPQKTAVAMPPLEPKVEIPPPEGPMVGLAVSVAPAASEPVAASDNAQPSTLPPAAVAGTDPDMSAPAVEKTKPKARGRSVKIR